MSFQSDYLLRIIERLAQAIARHVELGETAEADEAFEELTGLPLGRVDAMPPSVVGRMLWVREERRRERLQAVADALDAYAEHGSVELSSARRAKAVHLRGLADRAGG